MFITKRGRIEYVLISIEDYKETQREDRSSLLYALYMPTAGKIDLETEPRIIEAPRELSF